jgi:hypothetical protein
MKLNINISKYTVSIGLSVALLLTLTQCDKFTYFDFITPKDYILDSSAHEIEVITKQVSLINRIAIDGKRVVEVTLSYVMDRDTIISSDNYSIVYKKGLAVEIIGEWFHIKKQEEYTTNIPISINENNESKERTLIIYILGERIREDKIFIRQEK